MSVTFVRHFEQNSHRVCDSDLKRPLTRHAIPGSALRHYDAIICSPYARCRASARLWQESLAHLCHPPCLVDARLSKYQGGKQKRAKRVSGAGKHKKKNQFYLKSCTRASVAADAIPGPDETWEACESRLNAHWEQLQQRLGRGQRILVVTHGIVVRYMQLKLSGHSPYNCGRDVPFGGTGFTFSMEIPHHTVKIKLSEWKRRGNQQTGIYEQRLMTRGNF